MVTNHCFLTNINIFTKSMTFHDFKKKYNMKSIIKNSKFCQIYWSILACKHPFTH